MKNNKALFLNLDGTLIKTKTGRKFPLHSTDWKFIPETLDAIEYFQTQGFKIIIISNQLGIEEGYMTKGVFVKKIESICSIIEKELKFPTNSIIYRFCPMKDTYYTKPKPGMAYDMALEHELSLADSVMIGDTGCDGQFAHNAGIGAYFDIDDTKVMDWINFG